MKLTNLATRDTQTAIVQPVGATIVISTYHFPIQAIIPFFVCSFQYDFRERETQTADTSGCQRGSRILAAKKYVSYEEIKMNELNKIILIQRNWRRCLWQRLIKKSAEEWR